MCLPARRLCKLYDMQNFLRMKKHFRAIVFPLVCLPAAFCVFASCGDGEDGPGDGMRFDDERIGVVEMPDGCFLPTVTSPIISLQGGSRSVNLSFAYNPEGMLTAGTDCEVSFSPLSFIYSSNGGLREDQYVDVETNARGFITKMTCNLTLDYYPYRGTSEYEIAYNGEGRVVRIKATEYDIEWGFPITGQYMFEYENGNLLRLSHSYTDGNEPTRTESRTYAYAASQEHPNSGVPFFSEHVDDLPCFMFVGGFLGRPTSGMPVSCRVVSFDGEEETELYETDYDNAGRVAAFRTLAENGSVRYVLRYSYDE